MSAFDTLDRGLEAFLEQEASARMLPADLVDEVLSRTATRAPRPAWLARLRAGAPIAIGSGADARTLAIAVSGIGILVLLVLAAVAGSRPQRPLGDVVPSFGASERPAASATEELPLGADPDALLATWVADDGPIPSIGTDRSRVRLVFATSGGTVGIGLDDGGIALASTRIQPRSPTELRLILQRGSGECRAGDEGFYRYELSADGLLLTLSTDQEGCAARREAFARTWTRSLTGQSRGGTGVVDAFDPPFQVTLPPGDYAGTTYTDAVEVGRGDPPLVLYAFKDPQGFTDPCAQDGGTRRPVDPGADAFAAYVESIPGFSVTSRELQVDGHRTLHLGIRQGGPSMCTGERVVEWQAKAETGSLNWILGIGDPDSLYVVELPDATILFQVIGPTPTSGPTPEERAVLDTVQFLPGLPSSP